MLLWLADVPGKQVADAIDGVVGDAGKHVAEPGFGIDLTLQPHNLVVAVVAVALLERRLRGQQGPIPPFRQLRRRDVELPCQQLQWFAPQQPAYYSQLPLRRVALRRWPAGGLVSASFLGALRQARRLRPALLHHSVHSALLPLRSV